MANMRKRKPKHIAQQFDFGLGAEPFRLVGQVVQVPTPAPAPRPESKLQTKLALSAAQDPE